MALKETWDDDATRKRYCMDVVEALDHEKLVAGALYEKEDKELVVEFLLGGIHPDYRGDQGGTRLWLASLEPLRRIEDASGAEYITACAATWHEISQYLCLKQWGFKIGGVFPGLFTCWCGGQQEVRPCQVYFYKFVGDGEKYATQPAEWSLIPEVKKVWTVLEEINKASDDTALRRYRDTGH